MTQSLVRRHRWAGAILAGVVLLGVACGNGGDTGSPRPTTAVPVVDTSPPPPSVPPGSGGSSTSSSLTAGGTGTTRTIPTTRLPAPAETPIDQSLVPESAGLSLSFGQVTANGVSYAAAVLIDPFNSGRDAARIEINAGRTRSRFLGEFAIPDNQQASTAYRVDISLDLAAPIQTFEVRFGETKKVDLDLTGPPPVLRIKISVTSISNGSCCNVLAIGDARLR